MPGSKAPNMSTMPELPSMIGQPLRDMLRGVAVFADLTEETLAPAKRLLPDPVRSNFRSVLSSLEDVGARVASPRISHAEIMAASSFVTSPAESDADRDALIKVLAYGWDRSAPALTDRRFLFSEVVAARSLIETNSPADQTGFMRAAILHAKFLRARPISLLPALDMPMRGEDEVKISMIILSFFVWLVSERAASLEDEERLLDLAIALTMAKEDQIAGQLSDTTALSVIIEDLAEHL